jgi:hypothetical protein
MVLRQLRHVEVSVNSTYSGLSEGTKQKRRFIMHKHDFKGLCMLLVVGLILFVTGKNALAYSAGWEAVNNYNGYLPNLSECIDEGEKFEDAIFAYSNNWDVYFGDYDASAWEEDFKKTSLGGTDVDYADDVDLVLFSGHGDQNGFYFGTTIDDHQVHYNDADWGDQNLEFALIDACNVLLDNASKYNRWGWPVFEGLHYLCGYNTTCTDVDTRGEDFIKYAMDDGLTVRSAWINATIDSENGTKAAYMRGYSSGADTYNDHLWGFGSVSADPTPTTLYYLTWDC